MALHLLKHEHLAPYTSWRVGGAVDCLYVPASTSELAQTLAQLSEPTEVMFLGLGSNVLVRDGGLRGWGVWTQKCLSQIQCLPDGKIWVEAGVPTAKLARFAAQQGFGQAAFWAGIPGTVGGALQMNAGAFGEETWRWVHSVQVITRRGEVGERLSSDYDIGYRHIRLKNLLPSHEQEWFVGATFEFQERTAPEHAQALIRDLLKTRNQKQPIGVPSGGSVFKNPLPHYAGQLIEEVGLKGFQVGGACVSTKHANFIVNQAGARAHDIEQLIDVIHETVLRRTGILLETEVKIIGEKES